MMVSSMVVLNDLNIDINIDINIEKRRYLIGFSYVKQLIFTIFDVLYVSALKMNEILKRVSKW